MRFRMSAARSYRKYPEAIRLQVVKAKNPNLFPEYNIPRTTALYWIKNAHAQNDKISSVTEESLQENKIKFLELELEKYKALMNLVTQIKLLFPHDFKSKHVPTKSLRRKIIALIKEAAKTSKVSECLKLIGLSKSTYSNWLTEFYQCENLSTNCKQRKPNQITHDELEIMRRLITSKRYSYMPIQSLCLLAQRNGKLFCSLDSWYKYKRIFNWNRPRKNKEPKKDKIGIRAKAPNEIWHIDVTQVKIMRSLVVYIQAIYDNFSKFVLAWKVSSDISAVNTVELIKLAKEKALRLGNQNLPTIMSDGGSENDNHKVLNFINSKNIKRMIARVDIHFSNSMVESLFRMLKSNFLKHTELRSIHDVERKIDFYFNEHNENIPRYQFGGATPKEKFLNTWSEQNARQLKIGLQSATEKRKLEHKQQMCRACYDSPPISKDK